VSILLHLHKHSKSVQSLILYRHSQTFHRKLFYAHYRIKSTNSQNAFSSFHFTLWVLFYPSFWFVSYMVSTATFQLTFPDVCWINIIITTRGSQALWREKSFTCRNAIHQTEFDSLAVVRVAVALGGSCPRWQLSYVAVVLVAVVRVAVFWWHVSGWQLSWVAIVLGGSCPRWLLSG